MKLSRFTRGAALIAVAALTLSACARAGDNTNDGTDNGGSEDVQKAGEGYDTVQPGMFPQSDDGGTPVKGGTLTMAELSETRSPNPSMIIPTGASGGTVMVALYDQVMRLNNDTGQYEPRMAESVEHNDDYTEWTIKMRSGIKFSDGTDLNADAVIGSFNWYLQQRGFDLSMIGPLWGGAEKVDDLTVKVTLKESWANFPGMLARQLGFIVAPAAIGDGKPESFKPIGAGAFTWGTYNPGENLTLKANPNHWDGAPYLDELRLVWLGADQTKYEAYTSGTVHALMVTDPIIADTAATENLPRYVTIANNGQVITFNQNEGNPGAYQKARVAVAHAIDPKLIVDRAAEGKGYYGKTIFASISKWHNDDVKVNEFDTAKASALLEEAKAEGYDGKIVLTASDSPINREISMTIKAQLDAAGFETELDMVRNIADFISKLFVERSYSVASTGLQAVDYDPYLNLFSALHTKGASNITNGSDPEMDKLLDELRATPTSDEAAMKDVLFRIETRYQEQAPMVTFRSMTPTVFWQKNVYGVQGLNEVMTDFGKAWIKN